MSTEYAGSVRLKIFAEIQNILNEVEQGRYLIVMKVDELDV
ncbi:hypothetical protein Ptr902_07614 [Pyrenophora tritici-repentis]|uniref:Uncharacterized protein n=1 Tax=Pyrenophora tritici-repentis TaxID=45151 RepID=A0A834VT56_9PLEO|nr:hypothetical protein A1F99_052700 [Pyrenophora tritici-repentis]KAF7573277.1 hypothetical protein PtrM4_081820 [Pyrenophora tritici-repentis]KAI0569115.1 hypothetical protein Alg215_11828 [Pyrenophora tritici-repentis]KAI0604587.1 hypothetical protein TUN205_11165 [Pyrenophora tritici-repentis]KAI1516386.1 hypothetical protein Ptr86124_004923 [Pyrenophora tritici-repentis]